MAAMRAGEQDKNKPWQAPPVGALLRTNWTRKSAMDESSYTSPFGRPDDLQPLGCMPGSWFMVVLAVPTVISCWETFRVHLGLVAQHGLLERLSLIAEPFLMGAFLGSGVMQLLCNRGRWQPRA